MRRADQTGLTRADLCRGQTPALLSFSQLPTAAALCGAPLLSSLRLFLAVRLSRFSVLFNQQGALQATLPRKQGALLSRLNPSTTAGRSLVGACWCAGGVRLYEGGNLAVASLACEYECSCTALVRHATVRASLEQLRYETDVASRCKQAHKTHSQLAARASR